MTFELLVYQAFNYKFNIAFMVMRTHLQQHLEIVTPFHFIIFLLII